MQCWHTLRVWTRRLSAENTLRLLVVASADLARVELIKDDDPSMQAEQLVELLVASPSPAEE